MKRLIITALLALASTAFPFVAVALFLALVAAVVTYPLVTLALVVFGMFAYHWTDAYNNF